MANRMLLNLAAFVCLLGGNGTIFADARMFILPVGVDPAESTPGANFRWPVAPGESVRLRVYLSISAPGRYVRFYRLLMPCYAYWQPGGVLLDEYVVHEGVPAVEPENVEYVFWGTGIDGVSSETGCAAWPPLSPTITFLYANAGPPNPPELIPFVEGVRYLGSFDYRNRTAHAGTLTIELQTNTTAPLLLDETGAPIPFTTDGVLIVPDDSTEPGRCCEGSQCRVVSAQECGGLFERGGTCDEPCECSEINPCTRFFLTPQGYDGLSAPWGRHIRYTAAPGDEIAFDVFVDREDAWPGISGWVAETLCGYDFTGSGHLEFVPQITVDVDHPLYIYSNEPGWIAYYWGCGLPPVFTNDPPLVSSGLHSTMIQVSSPRYLGTMRYRVSDDAQGATVAYISNVPRSGIVLGNDALPPFRTEGVRIDVMPRQILSSDPADGAIDARQPFEPNDPEVRYGWNSIGLTFSGNLDESIDEQLSVIEIGGDGEAPQIASIDHLDVRRVVVHFDQLIEPGAWTCVVHEPSGTRSCVGYLPGDVSGDGTASPVDILKLIDSLNGVANPPLAAYQTDLDRSGQSNPADVLRLIDLLNGAGPLDPWNYASLPGIP